MVWNENGKWEMENANMQVQRQSWAEGVQVGVDVATASTCRQRGQLIVAARPTIAACTTLWHTKYIEEFCLPLTLSVLATKPHPLFLIPSCPACHLQHTHTLTHSLSRRLSFVATGEKCNKLWQKCCSQTFVGRGRQAAAAHEAHEAHEAQMKRYQVRQVEAAQLTHATHTHHTPKHTHTHSLQKERGHEERRWARGASRIAIEALSLCGCRHSRCASNSYKEAKEC